MNTTLAVIAHDPEGRLYDQIVRVLPILKDIFERIAVQASPLAPATSLALFAAAGARVRREPPGPAGRPPGIGKVRRGAVELALQLDAPFILYCDDDRILHWAEHYADELAQVAERIAQCDFTVLGRTQRAWDTHPRIQRDTEAIFNHVFALASGTTWDVGAGSRGLSRRAGEAILAGCPDEESSTDVSWPLFLQQAGGVTLGYLATEGLEFETADRYGDQIAAAGGPDQWMAQLDADPRRWAYRLELARIEVEGILPYTNKQTFSAAG